MRFLLDDEQRDFARSLDSMLAASGTAPAIRSWAAGDHGPGRALWKRIADAGVLALAVPERHGGFGPRPVDLAVAFIELGRHAVPGPLVESVAVSAFLDRLGETEAGAALLPGLASGTTTASLRLTGQGPYALDADAAGTVLVVDGDTARLGARSGPVQASADPARRLARTSGGDVLARGPAVTEAAAHAARFAALTTAAQSLGLGRALLARTVEHAVRRCQFGVPIGSFQAVKHRLADTLLALEFAAPLLYAAALALARSDPAADREIAAAKVTAGEAAYAAARTALQLHGALGYTDEFDLSLWIRKARPLRDAWGTPADCRARVLAGAGTERAAR